MNSGKSIKLTFDAKKKQYRKMIGKRQFWLGNDRDKALSLALDIRQIWQDEYEARGLTEWMPDDLMHIDLLKRMQHEPSLMTKASEILDVMKGFVEDDLSQRKVVIRETELTEATGTLSEAIAAYQQIVRSSKAKNANWAKELARRVGMIQDVLGDIALADFSYDSISKLVDTWVGRCKDNEYAAETLKGMLRAAKQFVKWLDSTDKFHWRIPRGSDDCFKMPSGLRGGGGGPRTFATEELQRLYQNARTNRLRLLMLLQLQCGFYQEDCATLTPAMCHLNAPQAYIQRPRHKTKQPGKWWLWPETETLLKEELAARPEADSNQPFLLTEERNPLVRVKADGSKLDSMALAWKRLRDACGLKSVAGTSLKYLRKTGSQLVRNRGGQEFADAFLAHKTRGIGASYHAFQKWDELGKFILEAREDVAKMFEPLPTDGKV